MKKMSTEKTQSDNIKSEKDDLGDYFRWPGKGSDKVIFEQRFEGSKAVSLWLCVVVVEEE